MNKLSPVIQSISPVQQSSPQSSPVIRYDRSGVSLSELHTSVTALHMRVCMLVGLLVWTEHLLL